ncbi:MAG: Do family serine endopeptidase, partial [Muribaculaceae bacterium]|nr:Do family serine endopeptidase [Muribaculaceae bacterium]
VVSIKSYASPRTYGSQGDFFNDPFFEFFFGSPRQGQRDRQQQQQQPRQRQTGLGSGVILSSDGYIVTNNHVIDGAERLEVTLNDNRNFEATIIGADPMTDVALIKIEANDLHVIPMGNSEDLKIGEWVLAVGNPFGFTSTVTAGIVSAKGRNISSLTGNPRSQSGIESFIQTDAAVNPGNSGGALVNLDGQLVGINTAIYSQTGNYAGYSFAVPTTIVKKIVADIKEFGSVQRAVLGIAFGELTPELAKEKDITETTYGLYVGQVNDRSAAMEAGIEVGDVIIAIDGVPTRTTADLQETMATKRPGDNINIEYVRNNKRFSKTVTLRNADGTTTVKRTEDWNSALGCSFLKVSDEKLKRLEISSGVEVTGVQAGRFQDAGVRSGFIITTINGDRVKNPDDVKRIYDNIMKSNDDSRVMFIEGIYTTGKKDYYAVNLGE